MMDNPIVKHIWKRIELLGLLLHYVYLRVLYVCLLLRLYSIKAAGALLIEAVKIECFFKSLSREDRIAFTACIAVSLYAVALSLLIRI